MDNKLDLLVVCENFGVSFSGGSTATARLIKEMRADFHSITIICKNTDWYFKEQLAFTFYSKPSEIIELVHEFSSQRTVLYGDFYKFHDAIQCKIPYYFTYHDNWPEMTDFTANADEVKDRISKYEDIFQSANKVFSVSHYKVPFIAEHTDKVMVVRNGLSQNISKTKFEKYTGGKFHILMIGNIDYRKYGVAIELFKLLNAMNLPLQIDIFGHKNEEHIFDELTKFEFVNYKGFKKEIDHNGYHLLLQTSVIENMSLTIVDAIANFTPILSFDVGGIKEIITASNGRIVKPYDIQKMSEIIQNLVADFPNFTFDPLLLKPFNWKQSAKQMTEIIYADVAIQNPTKTGA